MNSAITLVDTGILVALLNRKEQRHSWAAERSRTLPAPFLTCEAVLTEAYFLVSPLAGGTLRVFEIQSESTFPNEVRFNYLIKK